MHRFFALILSMLIVFGSASVQANDASQLKTTSMLTGYWEEYSPSSNIVLFTADGTVKIMLKKNEIGDLRTLDGKWKMVSDDTINMTLSAHGQTFFSADTKIIFRNNEMILIDKNGDQTKHRKHSGKLPPQYVW